MVLKVLKAKFIQSSSAKSDFENEAVGYAPRGAASRCLTWFPFRPVRRPISATATFCYSCPPNRPDTLYLAVSDALSPPPHPRNPHPPPVPR